MKIHVYAKDGNIAGVSDELAKLINVDARDPHSDHTPLMDAVVSSKAGVDMVRFLIERGADVNAVATVDSIQRNVLSLAVQGGDIEKVKQLLDAGADIRYKRPSGYDVLIDVMHGRMITRDSRLVPLIELLVSRGAMLNSVSDYGESALSVASNNGRFDAVRALLLAGADPSPLQWTSLMHAIALGSPKDVVDELERGADLKARDFWDRTPWLISLQVGDVTKAKLVREGSLGRFDSGRGGKVPLMYPNSNGHTEMLQWLLSEGIDPDDPDNFGTTPLIQAAEEGATESVRILIDAGADIHLADSADQTAIMRAANLETVRLLVESGADLNDISDEMRVALTQLSDDSELSVSHEDYLNGRRRRFGKKNPQLMNIVFWKSMITCGATAWMARETFHDE